MADCGYIIQGEDCRRLLAALSTFKEIRQVSGINQGLPNSEVHGLKKQKCSDCFARGGIRRIRIRSRRRRGTRGATKEAKADQDVQSAGRREAATEGCSTWLAAEGMMLVQGKEVKRRDSKAGLVSQAATSSPLPSITPLYMLAIAGLQVHAKAVRPLISLSHSP